jgi:TDG/mug DNA glycosylase family protein
VPDPSELPGFQAFVTWQGVDVLTLADVAPDPGGIVLVGINPSPVSVQAGHYYQGTLGKRLWSRLAGIGVLPSLGSPWEDERWSVAGNGLTDVVKRPTASAKEVSPDELLEGGALLREKLAAWRPGLILFPFLASAEAVLGTKPPAGRGPDLDGIATFRLAGPYAAADEVAQNARDLLEQIGGEAAKGVEAQVRVEATPTPRVRASAQEPATGATFSQPVTATDKGAGRIRFPRAAKGSFPSTRSTVTVVLRGIRTEGRYDPRRGPDRERSAVLSVGRQALVGVTDSERLRVSVRPTDGLVSLD